MRINAMIFRAISLLLFLLLHSIPLAQTLPEDPGKGEQLFISKGCVNCHGPRSEERNRGPDLSKVDLGDTQLDLAARIWNHTPPC
jgi:mono/diheme cytochrome c family protein